MYSLTLTITTMARNIHYFGILMGILLLFSFVSVDTNNTESSSGAAFLQGYQYDNKCQQGNGLNAVYFADTHLGRRATTKIEPEINFYLFRQQPKARVHGDRFSVRWTGGLYAPKTGLYTFYFNVDDGARVWIDDQLLLDEWDLNEATEFKFEAKMNGGSMHKIKVEYVQYMYDHAVAQLSWAYPESEKQIIPTKYLYTCPQASCFNDPSAALTFGGQCNQSDPETLEGSDFDPTCRKATGLKVEYFADTKLKKLVVTDVEPRINFDLYRERPRRGVPADEFSARWTGGLYSPVSGLYTFTMRVDDGARIWLDDQLVLDEWDLHEPTDFEFKVNLKAGQLHKVRVEYVQYMFNEAVAQLMWSFPGQEKSFVPMDFLYASANPDCKEIEPLSSKSVTESKKMNPVLKRGIIATVIIGILTVLKLRKGGNPEY